MDLSKLNMAQLKDLQAQVGAEMNGREKSDFEKARNDIKAIADSLGMSLKDLLVKTETNNKVRKSSGKVPVQYRNPQNSSQEWTGRGRQPRWVKELLASGKNLLSAKVSV